MFFNPTLHTKRGIPYATVVDGLVDGIRAAETDFGVPCRLIADVYRQDTPEMAREMVEQVLEHRRDEVIGLGMDGAEAPDPPEQFVEALPARRSRRPAPHRARLRGRARRRTSRPASTCSAASGSTTATTSSRTTRVVARCRDEGITSPCCPTATAVCYFDPDDYTTHPIREMVAQGLKVMINSDDPSMFHTDIGSEYVKMVERRRLGRREGARVQPQRRRRLVARRTTRSDGLRAEFEAELDRLEGELAVA